MQNKTGKIGYYHKGNASKYLLSILIFFLSPFFIFGQKPALKSLQESLLDLARAEKMSIVFASNNIPKIDVSSLSKDRPVRDQISFLLKDTDLFFEIKGNQIFLYKKHKVYGYIEDKESGERLISATIFLPESGAYEVSNNFGYYSISSKSDTLNLEVSYVGYKTRKIVLTNEEMNRALNISLDQDNSLTQVLITDNLVSKDDRKYIELDKGSDILLTQNQAITALGGEPDIFQTLVRQSGVSSGADGIGGIHIRGGKNDQNLILFDGVKLYNSAHAFGMFSIASSGVVDQVRLHKSGASGASSGRLSSIVDVRTKDPNLKTIKGSIQLSTLAHQATLEVPIVKDRLGVLLSGRRTHVDPYINHITKKNIDDIEIEGASGYDFYDLNLKVYGKVDKKNRLYFSLYQGRDNYTDRYNLNLLDYEPPYFLDEDIFYKWKNKLASFRWNRLLGKSSFVNFQVSGYNYDYRNKFAVAEFDGDFEYFISESRLISFNAQTTNYEIKADVETVWNNHHLKYGINASNKSYQIGEYVDTLLESANGNFLQLDPSQLNPIKFLGYGNDEMTFYLSDKMKISESWLMEAGIYQTRHRSLDVDFPLDPIWGTSGYVKTLNKINQNVYVGGSFGSFIQTEHLLTTADNGYPNDIWVPSTDNIPFQRSNQIELFSEIEAGSHNVRLSGYYKRQTGIIRDSITASLPGLADLFSEGWEFEVVVGSAKGFGFELDYTFELKDKISLHGVYSYGNMEYQFDAINEGAPFPFDYSIPHTFSLASNIKLSSKWRLILDWFYSSGKPFTLYESFIPYTPLDIGGLSEDAAISSINEFRQPDIHKLSLMFSTHWKWSEIQNNLSIGVQNLYNRKNVILQYALYEEGIKGQKGFPVLPMLLWRMTF